MLFRDIVEEGKPKEVSLVGADDAEPLTDDIAGKPSEFLLSVSLHGGDKLVLAAATQELQTQLVEGTLLCMQFPQSSCSH